MTVDRDKVRQKLEFIRDALEHLGTIRSRGREAFDADPILRAATLRFLQTALEALFDAAHHIVAREQVGLPKTYRETVDHLGKLDLVDAALLDNLRKMAGFRNRLVHLYTTIDNAEVWHIVTGRLDDFENIAAAIADRYMTDLDD